LALSLARAGHAVTLLCRSEEECNTLRTERENKRKLPGIKLPPALQFSADPAVALDGVNIVFFVVPSQSMRSNANALASYIAAGGVAVSAAKGLELGSHLRMSEILAQELGEKVEVAALSGPNLAQEIAEGHAATTVVAASDIAVAERVQDVLISPHLRVYTNTDLIGVELCGALKNVIALGAGFADGLEAGDNAKSALITRGLAEMARLGIAAGANVFTFAGLAGLGDVIATCASRYSRNRFVGQELAKGRPLDEIRASLGHVAEGVTTTQVAVELAHAYNIEMPITEQLYAVLFEGKSPLAAISDLMSRDRKDEMSNLQG
ncbi:MAG: glycerol-3-phosphate dehydrogenase, partial [Candidatus Chloroheliales bacterium]